jgi:cytochrome P450
MCRFISRFVPKQVEVKLIDIVTQTLKYRRDNNVVRHDFLHIMNQIKENSQSAGFSEVDVTAHAAGFFGDGYETSSIVMSFFLFNLSNNPVAQKKLREEIDAAFEDNDNKLPYDVLQGLSYLDAALNGIELDNFVKIPQFLCRIVANLSTGDLFERRCTKAFTFTPKMTNKLVTIDEGTTVILPIYGLQNDPKYYEEPDSYKPERFLGSNKDNLTKHTFLPLGEGPRSCLGA